MKIKCVITDDEPFARKGLKGYVEKVDFLSLVGECENALQLNTLLKTQDVDLLFLDIEMPYLSGLDFLSGLQNPPKVILTTAYEQYALKGYEFNVSDYLLKPISFERFLKAVNRIYEACEKEQKVEETDNYIFVKSGGLYKKIIFDDILYVESMENYVVIYTSSSKEIIHSTLKNMMEVLPSSIFLQVHRSYIVNVHQIQSVDGNQLIIGTYKIPVGKGLREEVFRTIFRNRLMR